MTGTSAERIAELHLAGMRSIEEVSLVLDGLTVLIGPNGSGKSTILEAFELLRLLGKDQLDPELDKSHGGLSSLRRRGSRSMSLSVRVEGSGRPLLYDLELGGGYGVEVVSEGLRRQSQSGWDPLLVRTGPSTAEYRRGGGEKNVEPIRNLTPQRLALHAFGFNEQPLDVARVVTALTKLEVHVPFDVHPAWTQKGPNSTALRRSNVLRPTRKLERFGENLANAWHALKNDFSEEHWRETMRAVRAGLGPEINSVATQADPGGGQIAIKLRYPDGSEDPAFTLSDGTLAYLAFVALSRLAELPEGRTSLLAFDEPELHLHPELLVRVVGFFEEMARTQPVVLATHSDRLLDVLSNPADSVVLCELDEERRTVLSRPNRARLEEWLERFRGVGALRAEGLEAALFEPEEDAGTDEAT